MPLPGLIETYGRPQQPTGHQPQQPTMLQKVLAIRGDKFKRADQDLQSEALGAAEDAFAQQTQAFEDQKTAHGESMTAYDAAKAQYDQQVADYQNALAGHNTALGDHNDALAAYGDASTYQQTLGNLPSVTSGEYYIPPSQSFIQYNGQQYYPGSPEYEVVINRAKPTAVAPLPAQPGAAPVFNTEAPQFNQQVPQFTATAPEFNYEHVSKYGGNIDKISALAALMGGR